MSDKRNVGRRQEDARNEFFTFKVSPTLIASLLISVAVNLLNAYKISNESAPPAREIDDLRARILQLEAGCPRR